MMYFLLLAVALTVAGIGWSGDLTARQIRIQYPDAVYQVYYMRAQGSYGLGVFRDDRDRQ